MAESLSEREHEILACLVEGLTNHEIAQRLHLAHRTVKWYNSQIYSKLGVNNREDAIAQAAALGVLAKISDEPEPTARHNLPTQTSRFIGRTQELADIARLLADPDNRLVTILAPGGMGKTRLALAAAERELRRYADGVFFVPLAAPNDPDKIVMAIAEHIGFSFYGSEPPKQQLLAYLRDRRVLLVLDNFEHLLDGATLVTDLIQAAPNVKVLATSREKLNLSGETVFALSGLDFPDWETPEDALDYDAVRLFLQSAHRVRPDFVLQPADLRFLAHICRLTEGMPLGIVLAAGWLDIMTLEQIAAEIQKGIDILETELRDVPERQRSIRATFTYTWERLNGAEQAAFMKLTVFRGGFTAEAAQAVAGANVRILRRLADKALVQVFPTGRYDLHELLRQFGAEQLREAGQSELAHEAHSTYYMNFMAEHDEDIKGRRQQAGLREIRTDFENIRQAWMWALTHRRDEVISRAALDCLVNFAEMNFSALEARTLLQQTVSAFHPASGELPLLVWDQAIVRRERVSFLLNEQIDHEPLEIVLKRARERKDEYEVAYCLWMLGDHAWKMGDYETHRILFDECLMLRQSLEDAFLIAHTFVGIAGSYAYRDQVERGQECMRLSARIRREIGDYSNLCFSLNGLSYWLISDGQFGEAEALLDEAFTIQAEIGRVPTYVGGMILKALLAFWRGELEIAAQHLHTAEDFAIEREYLDSRNFLQAVISWIASMGGDYQQGYAIVQQASSYKFFNSMPAFATQWGLALAHCGLKNNEAARRSLGQALNAAYEVKSSSLQQFCLPVAAVLAARAGQPARAAELLGLGFTAPKELTGWTDHWQLLADVQRDLEAELGAEAYAAAWERGAQHDLDHVVDELRTKYSPEDAEAR